jgi:two-component system sensor histidine kinase EvgS
MKVINNKRIITFLVFYFILQVTSLSAQTTKQENISLSSAELHWLTKNPIVTVAGVNERVPLDFLGEDGKHQGFSHDYLELISQKTGLIFQYKTYSWTEAYKSVLTKKNILLPALYQSPDRNKILLFSDEYHQSLDYFFTRNDIIFDKSSPFKNKRLALVKDFAIEPIIRKTYPELQIVITESIESAIKMVLEGRAELIYDSYTTIQYLLKKNAISNFIPYKIIEKTNTFPIKMATTKDNPELISIINKGMAVINIDERNSLLNKWGISFELSYPQKAITPTIKFSSDQRAWLASHPVIKVAANATWFPFDFINDNNKHDGLSQDILELITKKTGLRFDITSGPWLNSLAQVKDRTLDLLPALYKTASRETELAFSKSYYHPSTYFYTHNTSTLLPNSDISEHSIALVKGNAISQAVIQKHSKIKVTYTENISQAIQLLVNKKVELIVGAHSVINSVKNQQNINKIKKLKIAMANSTRGLHIAVRKDYQPLIPIINLALDSISEFTKEQLYRKWSGENQVEHKLQLTPEEHVWLSHHKKLNIAVDPNWAPYESLNNKGQHIGITPEIIDIISKQLNIEFNVMNTNSWKDSVGKFNAKTADLMSVSIQYAHLNNGIFTHDYLSSPFVIAMRNHHKYIENISEVIGKKITLIDGYSSTEKLIKQYPEQKFQIVATIEQGLKDLYTGRTDVLIGILKQINYHIIENGYDNLRVVGSTAYKMKLGFAVQPELTPLVEILNKAINNIPTKEKQEILKRWGQNKMLIKTDYQMAIIVSISALLIFMIFIYWNKKLQKAVASRSESEVTLMTVIANAPIIIFVTEKDSSELLMANPTARKSLAIRTNNISKIKGIDFYLWEQNQTVIDDIITKFKKSDRLSNEQIKLKNLDGDIIEGLLSVSPIKYHQQDAYLNIVVNLNNRMEMERQLEAAKDYAETANKAKSEFLANMSHEIRTPMNAIIGFTELLHEQIKDEKLKGFVKTIKSAGNSLLLLINDILDLSKIESNHISINKKVINSHDLFEEVGNVFTMSIRDKNLTLVLEIDPKIPNALYIDATRLRQILFNLVGNAVKFTDKGVIKLRAVAENEDTIHSSVDLRIDIIDTGIGIPDTEIDNIFENFQQQEGQSVRKYGGTGLGLTISKRLTELMDGTLTVTSKVNQGSCFSVILKSIEIASIAVERKIDTISPSNVNVIFPNCRILIVDDIKNNRDLLQEIFTGLGISTEQAINGEKAVKLALNEKFDLIMMDIRMPKMDGYQAAKLIKETYPDLPIVALTASVMRDDYELQRKDNFNGYLRKPVLKRELLSELQLHLPFEITENKSTTNENIENKICINTELTEKLKIDYLPYCQTLQQSNNLSDIAEFSIQLDKLSTEYNDNNLKTFAKKLASATESFDIKTIKSLLIHFIEQVELS